MLWKISEGIVCDIFMCNYQNIMLNKLILIYKMHKNNKHFYYNVFKLLINVKGNNTNMISAYK